MLNENMISAALILGIDPATLPNRDNRRSTCAETATRERLVAAHEDLTDEEFGLIQPHLPPEPRSAESIPNRKVVNGLLWSRSERHALTRVPARYGSAEAIRKRAERWAIAGVWDRLDSGLADLDLAEHRRAELRRLCVAYRRKGERIRNDRRAV